MNKKKEKYNISVDSEEYGISSPSKFNHLPISPFISPLKKKEKVIVNFEEYGVKSNRLIISDKILGEGTYSQVFEGNLDDKKIGIKQIKKEWLLSSDIDSIKQEISIHKELNHPNIIKFEGYEETNSKINIILEIADTSLANKIYRKRLPEDEIKKMTKELLNGIDFLHQHNIIHHDIKPNNVLIKDNIPKLCDFGHSQIIKDNKVTNKGIRGTEGFIAPEILKGHNYNFNVDIWSLGITIFIALSGYYPFSSKYNYVANYNLQFHKRIWENISDQAIDFIKNALCYDPNKRLSTLEALSHPWLLS